MKIIGNTVGTTTKRPDFNQTDPKKSDFIRNNPIPKVTKDDEGKFLKIENGQLVFAAIISSGGGVVDVYTKDEINSMFGTYVTEMANLIGGEALADS